MCPTFDFIIVGSGPSGASLAAKLAASDSRPSVLLLEAGSSRLGKESLIGFDRFPLALDHAPLNWPLATTPQEHLNQRSIDLPTGKAVGGSSAINVAMWAVGHAADYEEWARRVDDDSFNWTNVQRHLTGMTAYNRTDPQTWGRYSRPASWDQEETGEIQLEIARNNLKQAIPILDAFVECGHAVNTDPNSGEPLGVGVLPLTLHDSWRVTAAIAFLDNMPSNLAIMTDILVEKILFEETTAVGVSAGDQTFLASKEVIISAGALRTPQLLMISGVGPRGHLEETGITCVKDLPVGQTLQDHTVFAMMWEVKSTFSDPIIHLFDPATMALARSEFIKQGTGPLKDFYAPMPVIYLREPEAAESEEIKALNDDARHLLHPTLPLGEICPVLPGIGGDFSKNYLRISAFNLATTSMGSVTLKSANMADDPIVDPNYLSTAFDRRNAIALARAARSVMRDSSLKDSIIGDEWVPKGDSDDEVLGFVRDTAISAWHYSCSVRMAKEDDGSGCLGSDFRVFGINGLRVADMSAAPLLPQCHPQAVAYLIGDILAEKLCEEYAL